MLSILVYVAGILLALFTTLCLACGLFYIAEWMEENSEKTKRTFYTLIYTQMFLIALVWISDGLPIWRIAFSLGCHYVYSLLLKDFPVTDFSNPILIVAAVISVVNHFVWFYYFSNEYVPYYQIVTFFTLFVWITPFCFFLSLSAGENVLPTNTALSPGSLSASQKPPQNFIKSWIQYFLQKQKSLLNGSARSKNSFD